MRATRRARSLDNGSTVGSARRYIAACAVVLLLSSGAWAADEWGHVKGRFVLEGKPPMPQPINIGQPLLFCGRQALVAEDLIVAPDGGIKNVVVYLYTTRRDATKPAIHPDYIHPAVAVMDNVNCRFEPRVVAVTTGQPIELGNKDPVGHNMNITTVSPVNKPLNVLLPALRSFQYTFVADETLPVPVTCNIHTWMRGFVVVKDHPYVAITDALGNFEIKNVPVGTWKFKVWQEKAGFITQVKFNDERTLWKRGEVELNIEADETLDLGEIEAARANF